MCNILLLVDVQDGVPAASLRKLTLAYCTQRGGIVSESIIVLSSMLSDRPRAAMT
jgi:hypothetical protein